MAADGDWLTALYEYAQQQGPEAVENLRKGWTQLTETVGRQNAEYEAAGGGGFWDGDNYYAARSPEAAQKRLSDRYLNDLSWLDPSMQYNPSLLGESATSKVFADPEAQKAQWAALQRSGQMVGEGLSFDQSGRQAAQYGNLQDIIGGGGATAIEMADRARQRADSESWLRGQREADMADYAERGLTGSGMELLSLSSDRQAAAGRNSLADLQMAKDLEQRRMQAINDAAGLAGTMRGQTMQEQIAGRSAQESALQMNADLASKLRDTSMTEGLKRAEGTDAFALKNQEAINQAASENTAFRQKAWQDRMRAIQDWQTSMVGKKLDAAGQVMDADQRDNTAGFNQGTQVGMADTNAWNNAASDYRNAFTGTANKTMDNTLAANQSENKQYPALGEFAGQTAGTIGDSLLGGATGPTGGTGAISGAPLSQTGTTWAGAGGTGSTPEYDDLWKSLYEKK